MKDKNLMFMIECNKDFFDRVTPSKKLLLFFKNSLSFDKFDKQQFAKDLKSFYELISKDFKKNKVDFDFIDAQNLQKVLEPYIIGMFEFYGLEYNEKEMKEIFSGLEIKEKIDIFKENSLSNKKQVQNQNDEEIEQKEQKNVKNIQKIVENTVFNEEKLENKLYKKEDNKQKEYKQLKQNAEKIFGKTCKKNENVIADYILLKGKIKVEDEQQAKEKQEESTLWIYLRNDISYLYKLGFFNNNIVEKVKEVNDFDFIDFVKNDLERLDIKFNKKDEVKKVEVLKEENLVTKKHGLNKHS